MSLRDEIAELKHPVSDHFGKRLCETFDQSCEHCALIDEMLAIVDKHEAEMRTAFVPDETLSDERKLGYRLGVQDVLGSLAGHVKIDPSDERPARERLSKWASDDRNGDMPFYVHAIVEAIDANTAAVKASKS